MTTQEIVKKLGEIQVDLENAIANLDNNLMLKALHQLSTLQFVLSNQGLRENDS